METLELHFLSDIQPELEQVDTFGDDHPLEIRRFRQKRFKLLGRTELHDALNTCTVIPRTVEGDEFTRRGEELHVALKIPLTALGFSGLWQGDIARSSGVHELPDGEDCSTFASSIPPFKDADYPSTGTLQPVLHFDELDLKPLQRFLIILRFHFIRIRISARLQSLVINPVRKLGIVDIELVGVAFDFDLQRLVAGF